MIRPIPPGTRGNARRLRRDMTGPERKLWAHVKAHRMAGAHFRRQVPFGSYIADFACHDAKLVIEIDGDQHGYEEAGRKDAARDG